MAPSLTSARRQREDNSLDLPLIGAAPVRQPTVNAGDDTWILPLITRAIERSIGHKAAAINAGLDKGQMSRQLAGDGHLSVRRLALMGDDFWRELIDELRAYFHLDNDAEQLSRAFDAMRASLSVVERIATKAVSR